MLCGTTRGYKDYITSVFDADSRRWLKVTMRRAQSFLEDLENSGEMDYKIPDFFNLPAPMLAAIRTELDAGPKLKALVVTLDGEVLSRSTDPYDDITPGTHYAPIGDYQIPAYIKMLSRDELIEVTRLIAFVDIVTPVSSHSLEEERLVFKYYQHVFDIAGNWNAIHIGAKLSTHPHICPVRHIIVDEIDRSRVLGFTVPFFPGGDLDETRASRTFKLKWAKQLFRTLDDLHLKYGVCHGDVKCNNMVIDPATDNLVLIDFGCSGKIGTPPTEKHHEAALSPEAPPHPLWAIVNDICGALITVWGLITGAVGNTLPTPEGWFITVPNSTITKGGWVKAPDVMLDSPVEDYYKVTMDWLRERNKGPKITEHHQASEPLNYPDYMPPPQVDMDAHNAKELARDHAAEQAMEQRLKKYAEEHAEEQAKLGNVKPPQGVLLEDKFYAHGSRMFLYDWWEEMQVHRGATSGRHFLRLDAIEAGCPFLNWERPSTAQLDRTRRLLASGKYEDESASANIKTNKRKRKDSGEVESRDDGDNNSGNADSDERASGGNTNVTTKRITRSAKKQANTATPSAPKETSKAAVRKPTGKVATPKRAVKAAAPKPTRKAAASKPTRKAAAPKRVRKAAASKPTRKAERQE
jgi:serine/threonine protein kinase